MFLAGVSVTKVECDTDITNVERFTKKPPKGKGVKRYGYGGTDFRAPFKFVKDKKYTNGQGKTFRLTEKVDAIIYCTDGAGTYPDKIPCPTIWCFTSNHWSSGWSEKIGKKLVMIDD